MRWKISSKIMVAIMVCSATLSAIIGSIALFQSSSVIEEEGYKTLLLTAESYANDFSKTTEHIESAVKTMGASVNATIDLETLQGSSDYIEIYQHEIIEDLIKKFAETTTGILGAYLDINPELTPYLSQQDLVYGAWYVDPQIKGKFQRERLAPLSRFDPNNPEMKWYYDPITTGHGVWSNPYYDYDIDLYVISYTAPVYKEGVLIGVVGMDIIFDYFIDIIRSVQLYKTGRAALLSENYQYIVNPSLKAEKKTGILSKRNLRDEKDGKYLPVVEKMEKNSSGVIELSEKNQKTVIAFARQSNGYIVMIEVKAKEIFEKLDQIRITMDGIIIVGILIASAIAYILGRYISKPIESFSKHFKKTINFDFSEEKKKQETTKTISEMEQMTFEIQRFQNEMRKRLSEIESKNVELVIVCEELMEKVEKSIASNQILLTIFNAEEDFKNTKSEIENNIEIQLEILIETKTNIEYLQSLTQEIDKLINIFLFD